jgi:hypothetical protein
LRERRDEDVRILDRDLVVDPVFVPLQAFDGVQRLGVTIAGDLGLVVVADRVDDERVAVPLADGIAEPRGSGST